MKNLILAGKRTVPKIEMAGRSTAIMTYKEENIVNIAMRAAEMLKDGKIECDNINGFAGMTQEIISLADTFELMNKDVDYDASDRDYWIEIDQFAEQKLLELYGRGQDLVTKTPMIIYLCPQSEHTYSAAAALERPPYEGAIQLVEERSYPVDVFYARTDLNGSTCMECERCDSLPDLLSALDWFGKCRYTVHEIWDFDLGKTENQDLADLFGDAYLHRMKLIEKEQASLYPDAPESLQPLTAQIQGAQQRVSPVPGKEVQSHTDISFDGK